MCVNLCLCTCVCVCVANATFCQLILACLFPSFSLVGVCPNNKVEKRRQQEQEKEDGADAEEVMEKIKLAVSASTMQHAHACHSNACMCFRKERLAARPPSLAD